MTDSQEILPAPEPGHTLLIQVWQDQEGCLVVEMDGQRYRRVVEIRDRGTGTRLLECINRLVAFSKGKDTRKLSEQSPPTESRIEEREQAFFDQLQREMGPQTRLSRLTADPVPFRGRSAVDRPGINLDLADEIETLLQIRVAASPEFSQRAVHVRSSPDGGLRFDVDGIRYVALDDITDVQAQALIRAAIADWEAKR